MNSVHPGWVKTASAPTRPPMSVPDGAKTSVAVALLGPDGPSGHCHPEHQSRNFPGDVSPEEFDQAFFGAIFCSWPKTYRLVVFSEIPLHLASLYSYREQSCEVAISCQNMDAKVR